jgi:phage/plasmid-associated DNA primase
VREMLATERPGIFAWLVRGAARLRANGRYTVIPSQAALMQQWRLESDNVRLFVETSTTEDTEERTAASTLYAAYKVWAEGQGFGKDIATGTLFGRRLRLMGHPGKPKNKGKYYALIPHGTPGENLAKELDAEQARAPRYEGATASAG